MTPLSTHTLYKFPFKYHEDVTEVPYGPKSIGAGGTRWCWVNKDAVLCWCVDSLIAPARHTHFSRHPENMHTHWLAWTTTSVFGDITRETWHGGVGARPPKHVRYTNKQTRMALRRLHASANDSPLIQSSPIQCQIKLQSHQVWIFTEIYIKTIQILSKVHALFPGKLMIMWENTLSYDGPYPPNPQQKVTGVCSGQRLILHASFVGIFYVAVA